MFINPTIAIQEKWITHPQCTTVQDFEQHKFLSPNAIDFPVDRIFDINEQNTFIISEHGKQMKKQLEMEPIDHRDGHDLQFWTLPGGRAYDFMSSMYVEVPEGVACMLVPRSTLVRNGILLASGLYDTSFKGNIGGVIFNPFGPAKIARHTRIGQIIFIESDNAGQYAGGYNTQQGKHWKE